MTPYGISEAEWEKTLAAFERLSPGQQQEILNGMLRDVLANHIRQGTTEPAPMAERPALRIVGKNLRSG